MEVKLSDSQKRFRQEMGDVKELLQSILDNGQIQPILITRDNQLVCGGRRLAACLMGSIKVKAIYTDEVEPLTLRTLELEENLKRKAFTPAEEVSAVKEIHELKQKQYGASTSGKEGGWTLKNTAALLGKTHATIIRDMNLADMVARFPELANAKKKSEIDKAAKGLDRLTSVIATVAENKQKTDAMTTLWSVYQADATAHMRTLPDNSVDILLTDPPYGIDIDKTAGSAGGTTGGYNISGFTFDDSLQTALPLYETLAKESFRFTANNAHGFVFLGPEFFWAVRQIFAASGWLCYPKPIVWIKRTTGQCNAPHAWPSSCYEMALYCRKADSRFIQEGRADWVECDIVKDKTHPTEKPVRLGEMLLERISLPGQLVYDPFMGSGAFIESATRMKLRSIGCDILTESYATALNRMTQYEKEHKRD
jgi:site-specific DNA-methyltransferase (adenine-specific)